MLLLLLTAAANWPMRYPILDRDSCSAGLVIAADQLSVRYTGEAWDQQDVGVVLADEAAKAWHDRNDPTGVFYFEVTIVEQGESTSPRHSISLGFADNSQTLDGHPG